MRFFTEAGAPARPPARAENHALKTMCAENEHKMLLHPRSCCGPCVQAPDPAPAARPLHHPAIHVRSPRMAKLFFKHS